MLGYIRRHRPRYAKVYRHFRAEFERLQRKQIATFKEFIASVDNGICPSAEYCVAIPNQELDAFINRLPQ